MTRNNLLSEKLNYTGASHTPTHLHFCTYNTEILEYHQGASIKEFSPFIRPDAIKLGTDSRIAEYRNRAGSLRFLPHRFSYHTRYSQCGASDKN
mgnify:CR=1 FL=1